MTISDIRDLLFPLQDIQEIRVIWGEYFTEKTIELIGNGELEPIEWFHFDENKISKPENNINKMEELQYFNKIDKSLQQETRINIDIYEKIALKKSDNYILKCLYVWRNYLEPKKPNKEKKTNKMLDKKVKSLFEKGKFKNHISICRHIARNEERKNSAEAEKRAQSISRMTNNPFRSS